MSSLTGSDNDNATSLARDHVRNDRAHGIGGAIEINIDDIFPLLVVNLSERPVDLDGGVGDADVDLAKIFQGPDQPRFSGQQSRECRIQYQGTAFYVLQRDGQTHRDPLLSRADIQGMEPVKRKCRFP